MTKLLAFVLALLCLSASAVDTNTAIKGSALPVQATVSTNDNVFLIANIGGTNWQTRRASVLEMLRPVQVNVTSLGTNLDAQVEKLKHDCTGVSNRVVSDWNTLASSSAGHTYRLDLHDARLATLDSTVANLAVTEGANSSGVSVLNVWSNSVESRLVKLTDSGVATVSINRGAQFFWTNTTGARVFFDTDISVNCSFSAQYLDFDIDRVGDNVVLHNIYVPSYGMVAGAVNVYRASFMVATNQIFRAYLPTGSNQVSQVTFRYIYRGF